MEWSNIVSNRRSIRKYRPDPVEPEKLRKILEDMRMAPSAVNRQEWKFIIVTNPELRRKIAGKSDVLSEAPALLIAAGTGGEMTCGHLSCTVDLTIAMTVGVLAATNLGLGSCFVASFRESDVREALGFSEEWRIP